MDAQTGRVGGRPKSGMEETVRGGRCSHDSASACSASLVQWESSSRTASWHQGEAGSSRKDRQKERGQSREDRALASGGEGESHEWSHPALGRAMTNTSANVSSTSALSEEQLERGSH